MGAGGRQGGRVWGRGAERDHCQGAGGAPPMQGPQEGQQGREFNVFTFFDCWKYNLIRNN